MYIFIDESGTNKEAYHSVFALAYITVQDYQHIAEKIQSLERELGIDEFHWSSTIWSVKERFMRDIFKENFSAKLAILSNPIHPERELLASLRHMIIERDISAIFLDGKKPKWYERKLKAVLNEKGIAIGKLKTVNSAQYPGIRLADLVAGLARSYADRKHIVRIEPYYRLLEKKISVIIQPSYSR